MAGRAVRHAAPVPIPPTPSPSALEPLTRPRGAPAHPAPASAAALPVARPLRSAPAAASMKPTRSSADPQTDLEPHVWESAACVDDQEDWTRVPSRRSVPASSSASSAPVAMPPVRRLSAADAAAIDAWRPAGVAAQNEVEACDVIARDEVRQTAPRPELRPLPSTVAVDTSRHSTATPVFAPSRDEDQAMHRPVHVRVNYPTPIPTPWRIEALQVAADELTAPRFPSLADVVAHGAPVRSAVVPSSTTALPFSPMRRNHDSSDLAGAWPALPAARVPSLRSALPDADRWPDLPGDETEEGNDPDLSLPAGHRERLEREQRGLSWNG